MQVCVCGWYFNERFLDTMKEINKDYPVSIIANRDELPDKYKSVFNYHVRENKGLEYGAYDYFLKNEWNGGDVLFLHDDMTIQPIIKNYEIINPKLLFKTVSEFDKDVVYIFKNDASRKECFDIHGRVMFASGLFLKYLADRNGGFQWDKENDGYTAGPNPGYCKHYNWAVAQLRAFWEPLKLIGHTVETAIIPAFDYDVRGISH